MRFVVFGAGAIGGVVGARLFQAGFDVLLIGRGEHAEAIRTRGLRLEAPDQTSVLDVGLVEHPRRAALVSSDVVVLAVKSQQTADALVGLAEAAPPGVAVLCAQNGVANEPAAARLFPNVYGMVVMCPGAFTEPGVVQAHAAPTTGIMDLGRYPSGRDERAAQVAAALETATFVSVARPDIMPWKYRKLLLNLGNSIQALCGKGGATGELRTRAVFEGQQALAAAGIAVVSPEEDRARRGDLLVLHSVAGSPRSGGSTWQSLERGAGSVETDYLNGEIVLLGRLHGVATPVNELLQRLMREAVASGARPGSMTEAEILGMV